MKLYLIPDANPGERWHSSKTGLKDPTEVEMPKAGRAAMADFLNDNEHTIGVRNTLGHRPVDLPVYEDDRPLDDLEKAELRAVAAAQGTTLPSGLLHYDYRSPFAARTALAGMDAVTIADGVKQMHGAELKKIADAVIDRISQLAEGTTNGT